MWRRKNSEKYTPQKSILYCSVPLMFIVFFTPIVKGQLIISQYYEGEKLNKWLEITNTSDTPIDLDQSDFYVAVFANQKAENPSAFKPSFSRKLTGTLAPGESILFRNGLTKEPKYALPFSIGSTVGAFNGDDLIILTKSKDETAYANRFDMIGEPGKWGIDQTWIRKPNITEGSTTFDPNDWEVSDDLNVVDFNNPSNFNLGIHVYDSDQETNPEPVGNTSDPENEEEQEDQQQENENEQGQGNTEDNNSDDHEHTEEDSAEESGEESTEDNNEESNETAIQQVTSVEDDNISKEIINIYPIPMQTGSATIEIDHLPYTGQTFKIRIIEMSGKVIKIWENTNLVTMEQDFRNIILSLPPSLYVISLTNEKHLQVFSLTITE